MTFFVAREHVKIQFVCLFGQGSSSPYFGRVLRLIIDFAHVYRALCNTALKKDLGVGSVMLISKQPTYICWTVRQTLNHECMHTSGS